MWLPVIEAIYFSGENQQVKNECQIWENTVVDLILQSIYLGYFPFQNINGIAVANNNWITDYTYSDFWIT